MPGRVYPAPAPKPASLSLGTLSGNGGSNAQTLSNTSNNFTVELWVKPTSTHQIDAESSSGNAGNAGQKYVIEPPNGSGQNAGMGISVGTNGVSVYERSGSSYMPALLVWQGTVTDWTHVAVVYTNKKPSLYINGELVRTGVLSGKNGNISPGDRLVANAQYGSMTGQVDEVRIWKVARTQAQIKEGIYKPAETPQANLEAYWPIQPGETSSLADISGNNHNITLPSNGISNNSVGAPVSQDFYRYGFNGKENDNEVKGSGNQQDYGARIYDPRLGRFLSVDPSEKKLPSWSTYTAFGDNPIINIDPDGHLFIFHSEKFSDLVTVVSHFAVLATTNSGFYVINQLNNSPNTYIVEPNSGLFSENLYKPNLNTLRYDPNKESVSEAMDKYAKSPLYSLGHELEHAFDDDRQSFFSVGASEAGGVNAENYYRKVFGLTNLRSDYNFGAFNDFWGDKRRDFESFFHEDPNPVGESVKLTDLKILSEIQEDKGGKYTMSIQKVMADSKEVKEAKTGTILFYDYKKDKNSKVQKMAIIVQTSPLNETE